jgi:hypothetical protein
VHQETGRAPELLSRLGDSRTAHIPAPIAPERSRAPEFLEHFSPSSLMWIMLEETKWQKVHENTQEWVSQ